MNRHHDASQQILINRRAFCKAALATLSATAAGHYSPFANAQGHVPPHQAFSSSFTNVAQAYGPTQVRFDNPLPDELSGTLYRNGPARMQRGHTRYEHWFDGDGMLHAFNLQSSTVTHRAKFVNTSRSIAEEAAGHFLRSGFGTSFNESLSVTHPDELNAANISVLPLGDEVLALWEAGSPWRLDSKTLDTLGRKVFSAETDGLPFSAHPRLDPTGRIWNFGYLSGSGKLALYELTSDGVLSRTSIINAPNADMVHDFAITDRYLVFILMPLHFNADSPATAAFTDRLQWQAEESVQVLVIDKNDLQAKHRFELPAFFAFHLGNAWQLEDKLTIEVATAPDFHQLMHQITLATTGIQPQNTPVQPQAAQITLDLNSNKAAFVSLPTSGIDFPAWDNRFTGNQTNSLFMLGRSASMPDTAFGFNRLCAMDRRSASESVFTYGPDTLAEEHLFIPSARGVEGHGWLLGTSYNWNTQRTAVSVFNARHLEDGPIAQAHLPYALPLGLHGKFV